MQAYFATRLSPRLSMTAEGFLICKDAVLCRTGEQQYRGSEVGMSDGVVVVHRPKSEVYDPKFLASLEGAVICDGHPSGGFVTSDSAAWSVRGHVQNVRPGPKLKSGEDSLIGDLHIFDATLIQKVLSGQARELSIGYSVRYAENADGSLTATKMRGNHLAVVSQSRCGKSCCIQDSIAPLPMDFVDMAARFHRKNAGEVALHSGSEKRAADALPESLRRGEPMSWDEVRAEHTKLTDQNGDEMENEEEIEMDPDELEEETDGEDPEGVLENLRAVKPIIQASGDRAAIDSYNAAIKIVKRRIADRSRVLTADQQPAGFPGAAQSSDGWVDAHRRLGARMRGERVKAEPTERRARDCASTLSGFVAHRQSAEDYQASIAAARERMLRGEK